MPIRRAPSEYPKLEEAIEQIEATEEIVEIVPSGAGAFIIRTKPLTSRKAGARETRA